MGTIELDIVGDLAMLITSELLELSSDAIRLKVVVAEAELILLFSKAEDDMCGATEQVVENAWPNSGVNELKLVVHVYEALLTDCRLTLNGGKLTPAGLKFRPVEKLLPSLPSCGSIVVRLRSLSTCFRKQLSTISVGSLSY